MNRESSQFTDGVTAKPHDAVEPDVPIVEPLVFDESEGPAEVAGTIRAGKLAGKSMWSAILILALPVLLHQLMTAGVGLVDKILAGSLPDAIVVAGLDAIGIGSYVGWFIIIAMAGLGIGGQAVIARAMGAGRLSESSQALGQAFNLSVLWGALVGIVMWFAAVPLAEMCHLSAQAIEFCVQYIRVLALAMPFAGIMMVGSMCLYGAGDTLWPSLIAVVVNVVNVISSWVLSGVDIEIGERVLVNPFGFDLHVAGIAAGTSLSFAFGGLATAAVLIRGVKDLRLEARALSLDRPVARRIISVGVPNFFEGLAMWGVNLFVIVFIGQIALAEGSNGVGEGLQGAHIIAVQWESLSFLPGFAMGTAAGALAGQYLGAGNPRMAQQSVFACTGIACLIMGGLGVFFMTQGRWLTSIISSESIHLEQTPRLLFIAGTIQIFFAVTMVVRQGLRGMGDTMWAFLITSVSSYLVRLPAAWVLGVYLGLGLEGVWYGLCGEIVVRAALFAARFLHGGWKRIRV